MLQGAQSPTFWNSEILYQGFWKGRIPMDQLLLEKKNVSYSPMNLFLAQILVCLCWNCWNSDIRKAGWWVTEVCQCLIWIGKWTQRMPASVARQLFAKAEVEVKGRDCGLLLSYCYVLFFFFSFGPYLSHVRPQFPNQDQTCVHLHWESREINHWTHQGSPWYCYILSTGHFLSV